MKFDLNEEVEKIKKNKNFKLLEKVIEENLFHKKETTHYHCIRTYEIARKNIDGNFITNKAAKGEYDKYVNQIIDGVRKKDLMQIAALIHDIGKIIKFKGYKEINTTLADGSTLAPEHGYWGSLIVGETLKDTNLTKAQVEYIANIVNVHNDAWEVWLDNDLSLEERLWRFKLSLHNLHIEVFFNIYCDLYYASAFKRNLKYPIELLNMTEAYSPLKIGYID